MIEVTVSHRVVLKAQSNTTGFSVSCTFCFVIQAATCFDLVGCKGRHSSLFCLRYLTIPFPFVGMMACNLGVKIISKIIL
jgi:hypothetical protein